MIQTILLIGALVLNPGAVEETFEVDKETSKVTWKPSILGIGGGHFRHLFGVLFGPRFRTSFSEVFCRFSDPLGLHFGVPGPSFPALCFSRFSAGFRVPAGGGGCRYAGSVVPGLRLWTFRPGSVFLPCV